MKITLPLLAVAATMTIQAAQNQAVVRAIREQANESYTVFVGSYTSTNGSKGIYKFTFKPYSGEATTPELVAEIPSPSFLAIHQNGKNLYAVNEAGKGGVTAYSISADRKLTKLNEQPSVGGGPCHINVDREGKNVLIANYGGGSIAAFPLNADGSLKPHSSFIQHTGSSVNQSRQKEPHAHSINLDRSGKYAFVADLGLDKVITYSFDSSAGKLTESGFVSLKPGSGPRHFAFAPDFKRAYVINELSSTLTAFTYDGNGKLTETQTLSTIPEPTPGNSTAEVVVHPLGKYVYGSNRGHNSIAVFSIDDKGELKLVQNQSTEGKVPRNFALDPTGNWLLAANQNSDTITIFKVDTTTGKLTYTGKSLAAFRPVCLRFLKN